MTYSARDITILITCYKEGELLRRAFQSLDKQTVQGFQVVLVNDCSPDTLTNQICHEFSLLPHVTYIRHTMNLGLSGARNSGFENMKGPIAMPLDADDTLPENAVELTLKTFNRFPQADMIFGNYALLNADYETTEVISCADLADNNHSLDPYKLARDWKLMGQSPCKKSLWSGIGGYSMNFSNTVQDVDFWRRATLKGFEGRYVPETIYNWRRLETGMNSSVTEAQYLQLRIASLPFYNRFNPEYGMEMRQYIYRYYSSRLMHKELSEFVKKEAPFFSPAQKAKASLMRYKILYKILRRANNLFQ